jgi:hypothetical protein
MMRRIVFHIGPEKTGSTLIQNYLALNVGKVTDLRGRGIDYYGPVDVRDDGLLAESQGIVRSGAGGVETLRALLERSSADVVIVSHESLFGHPDTAGFYGSRGGRRALIARLAEAAENSGRPEFVYYYKPPHKLVESYYRHHVVHGGCLLPIQYLELLPLLEMSFVQLHADLIERVGEEGVTVLDATIRDARDFFFSFCAALGLAVDPEGLRLPKDTNRSWSALKIELTRHANASMSQPDRDAWVRTMSALALGEAEDAPLIPAVVTSLLERLYAPEHDRLKAIIARAPSRSETVA